MTLIKRRKNRFWLKFYVSRIEQVCLVHCSFNEVFGFRQSNRIVQNIVFFLSHEHFFFKKILYARAYHRIKVKQSPITAPTMIVSRLFLRLIFCTRLFTNGNLEKNTTRPYKDFVVKEFDLFMDLSHLCK